MTTEIFGVGVVPLILGLVQAARQGGLPSHFAPLLSIALGILAGVALQVSTPGAHLTGPLIVQGVVIGLSLGLAASGLFSAVAKWTTTGTVQPLQPSNAIPEPPPPPMVP